MASKCCRAELMSHLKLQKLGLRVTLQHTTEDRHTELASG